MSFNQVAFGNRLRETRKERGLTQEQLATMLNISTHHLGNIEAGRRGISIELLVELSSSLDVSLDILIVGTARPSSMVKELLKEMQVLLSRLQELHENPA